ncbi:Galactose oxidase/kelch repeat superfamily protein, partial [Thalictrum thalictroides]
MSAARSFFAAGIIDGIYYVAGAVLNGKFFVTEGWLWPFLYSPRGQVYDPRSKQLGDSAILREGWTGLSTVIDGHLFVVSDRE